MDCFFNGDKFRMIIVRWNGSNVRSKEYKAQLFLKVFVNDPKRYVNNQKKPKPKANLGPHLGPKPEPESKSPDQETSPRKDPLSDSKEFMKEHSKTKLPGHMHTLAKKAKAAKSKVEEAHPEAEPEDSEEEEEEEINPMDLIKSVRDVLGLREVQGNILL